MRKVVLVSLMTSLAISFASFAGQWIGSTDAGWKYLKDDGTYATNGWQQDNGLWYYFDQNGNMLHDQWVEGKYYLGSDGSMYVNATTPDGYRVGADGAWIQETGTAANNLSFDEKVKIVRNEINGMRIEPYGRITAVNGSEEQKLIFVREDYRADVYLTKAEAKQFGKELSVAYKDFYSPLAYTVRETFGSDYHISVARHYNGDYIGTQWY